MNTIVPFTRIEFIKHLHDFFFISANIFVYKYCSYYKFYHEPTTPRVSFNLNGKNLPLQLTKQ